MKDLNQKKEEYRGLEQQRLKWFKKRQKRIQQDFEVIKASDSLLELQYNSDVGIISEQLTKWLENAKNDNQKKIITELFMCVMRMSNYTETIRILSKRAVAELNESKRNLNHSENQRIELKKENEILKKEIEFISKK